VTQSVVTQLDMMAFAQTVLRAGTRGWNTLFRVFVAQPITTLYLHGPMAVGLWGGTHRADICARLTRVDAAFWVRNVAQCDALIERDTSGWVLLFAIGTYIYLLTRMCCAVVEAAFCGLHRLVSFLTFKAMTTIPPRVEKTTLVNGS
jgi:fumarate reductase subunit D